MPKSKKPQSPQKSQVEDLIPTYFPKPVPIKAKQDQKKKKKEPVAFSIMLQQGFIPGKGLGKNLQGRRSLVEPYLKGHRQGLGFQGQPQFSRKKLGSSHPIINFCKGSDDITDEEIVILYDSNENK